MKKLLLSISVIAALVLSACSSKKEIPARDMVLLNDSLYRSNASTDLALKEEMEEAEMEPVVQRKSAPKRRPVLRETPYQEPEYIPATAPPVVVTPAPIPTAEPTVADVPTVGNTERAEAETKAEAKKKTGISKAAQGAIIGGVGGAVAGAVIGKKKGKSAVIGAVIGAAGGYVLGRKKDKKEETNQFSSTTFFE